MADPIVITKSLAAASATNICLSQTPLAAGNLTINGAAASGGVATLDTQRRVLFTFGANETGHTFVVFGTREGGIPIKETVAGTTAGTVATNLDFLTVTQITISAAATGAITVGTNGVGSTRWLLPNMHITSFEQQIAVVVTGTVNYSVEYTYTDYYTPQPDGSIVIPTVFTHPILSALTATNDGSFDNPIRGWRTTINSGTGSVVTTGIQAGISN